PTAAPAAEFAPCEAAATHPNVEPVTQDVIETAALRLRALEWFERARERLLRRFAHDVLARELLLAPADIQKIAQEALRTFEASDPRAVAVASADLARVNLELPVGADPTLEPGDLAIDVEGGRLLSSLRLRMDRVIGEVLAEATTA
ncbi:MAG TPA: hypothetical protein VME66_00500, partial [Candidatus Acidoferrales bacterium]|nr:hypothetical protein [Candidatus Acidoferrales bacterium]